MGYIEGGQRRKLSKIQVKGEDIFLCIIKKTIQTLGKGTLKQWKGGLHRQTDHADRHKEK